MSNGDKTGSNSQKRVSNGHKMVSNGHKKVSNGHKSVLMVFVDIKKILKQENHVYREYKKERKIYFDLDPQHPYTLNYKKIKS